MVIDKLPFDKYELEPSPLTQYILERKSPHMCWQVFVSSIGKQSELGHPFGYLKASTTLTCVNLFVMPYNYPVLLPLLDDLFKVHKLKPNLKWRQAFEMYLKTMPPYYLMPLKKAMRMMGTPNLIADTMDCGLSYSVISYLKKLSQQAKLESDRVIVSVGKKAPQETFIKVKNHCSSLSLAHRRDFQQLLQGLSGDGPLRLGDLSFKEFAGFQIALLSKEVKPQAYRNAYDIPRRNLLDQLTRMRSNLLRTSQKLIRGQDEDYLHSIPVAQMGNYQEYLKMMPSPLREIDPDQPKRLHTFGNPFKQDKKGMMIDEADEFVAGPQNKKRGHSGDPGSGASMKRRRSMSPLLRRPQTPPGTANHLLAGKGVAAAQGQQGVPKATTAQGKGLDVHNTVAESNGDVALEPESEEGWPSGASSPSQEEEPRSLRDEEEEEEEQREEEEEGGDPALLLEDHLMEAPALGVKHNCERLSPQSLLDGPEDGPPQLDTIFIEPLDGSQAELRGRVIKEVRKPGRNFAAILALLQQVKGPVNVRKYFIQHAISEAARFKKRILIQQLETTLAELNEQHATPPQPPDEHAGDT